MFDKNKFNGVLQKGKELFKFELKKNLNIFLKSIHVDDKFKVTSSEKKETKRKPAPPFITSTL